ncbi:type II secretion system protein [Vibrio alginolyticus]|uniref:type II secretion system protein n=1 Tax=Vibrio alginolyticus TaxID=663 RepID=UPI0038B25547
MWGYCLGLVEIRNVKSKGFTLMEITIVLTTLAFIALAALPVFIAKHTLRCCTVLSLLWVRLSNSFMLNQ